MALESAIKAQTTKLEDCLQKGSITNESVEIQQSQIQGLLRPVCPASKSIVPRLSLSEIKQGELQQRSAQRSPQIASRGLDTVFPNAENACDSTPRLLGSARQSKFQQRFIQRSPLIASRELDTPFHVVENAFNPTPRYSGTAIRQGEWQQRSPQRSPLTTNKELDTLFESAFRPSPRLSGRAVRQRQLLQSSPQTSPPKSPQTSPLRSPHIATSPPRSPHTAGRELDTLLQNVENTFSSTLRPHSSNETPPQNAPLTPHLPRRSSCPTMVSRWSSDPTDQLRRRSLSMLAREPPGKLTGSLMVTRTVPDCSLSSSSPELCRKSVSSADTRRLLLKSRSMPQQTATQLRHHAFPAEVSMYASAKELGNVSGSLRVDV